MQDLKRLLFLCIGLFLGMLLLSGLLPGEIAIKPNTQSSTSR
jgi:hypothetical protein